MWRLLQELSNQSERVFTHLHVLSLQQVAQTVSQINPAMTVRASRVGLQCVTGQVYINANATEFDLALRTLHAKLEHEKQEAIQS